MLPMWHLQSSSLTEYLANSIKTQSKQKDCDLNAINWTNVNKMLAKPYYCKRGKSVI